MKVFLILSIISALIQGTQSFTVPQHISTTKSVAKRHSSPFTSEKSTSTTALAGRQWNFNEGRGPYGFKKNAEVWNGRVAQVND